MTHGETIKEIDEDLTRLSNLIKTDLNDEDEREARANIDRLLEKRTNALIGPIESYVKEK